MNKKAKELFWMRKKAKELFFLENEKPRTINFIFEVLVFVFLVDY